MQRCPGCGNTEEWYVHYCRVCGKALGGHYRRALADFQARLDRGDIPGVEVLPQQTACPACRELKGKVFKPAEIPPLPHAACTHPDGCRCSYVASGPWRWKSAANV